MNKILTFVLIVLTLSFYGCTKKHYDARSIYELYDKEWLIGKTKETITDKYGEFDREYEAFEGKEQNVGAYYVNCDDRGFILPPSYIHDTFFIYFDENGVAVAAYFAETSVGG